LILHTLTTTDGETVGTVREDVALRHLESAPPYLWPIRQHPFLVAHTDTGDFPLLVELGPGIWVSDVPSGFGEVGTVLLGLAGTLTDWPKETLTPDTGQG
jgi:hypothetical protein